MFKLLKYKLQNLDGLHKLENLIKVHVETKPFKIFRHIYNILSETEQSTCCLCKR